MRHRAISIVFAVLAPVMEAQPVVFSKDVAPILFTHCTPCHRQGEGAPFPLLTFEDARKHAVQIVEVTRRRFMPPWPPEAGHGEFAGTRRLSDAQIRTISRWVEAGANEGSPADLPSEPKFPVGWQLGKPDLVVTMRQPYRLGAGPGDVFRNFVLPVDLKESKYVRAFELQPGDRRLVHHANLLVDRAQSLRARDGQDGSPGFSGMDVITESVGRFDPDSHFLFWKPGSPAQEEPNGMAWRLDPGSDLIVNLHLQPSGKPELVEARLGLYFTSTPPTQHPMLLQLEHDGKLDIPPGDARFTITDSLKLPIAVDLLAIYPHAHYLGKKMEAWATSPNGVKTPLLLINDWDMKWQASYNYVKPVPLAAGTIVSMRIAFDNSAANVRNPNRPPRRVVSGNRSEDEMGHVWLQVLPKANGAGDPRLTLEQAMMRRRIEKYPADFVGHFNLGAALQAEGKDAEAIPYLAKAVKIRPTSATAHNSLATSLMLTGKLDAAISELHSALANDGNYHNARYNLARALAANGDAMLSIKEFLLYLEQRPDDVEAETAVAGLLASERDFKAAAIHYGKAATLKPNDADLATNLGTAFALTGDLKQAVEAFEKALAVAPDHQQARRNLELAKKELEGRR